MALTTSTIQMSIRYTDEQTPVAGGKVVKDTDSETISSSPVVGTYNRRLRQRYSLAASGTQLIDLASFVDPYTGATIVLTKATGILLTGTQPFTIGPNNAANPISWIWNASTEKLVFGANEGFCALKAITFTTASKMLLTNTGASTGTFDVLIIGGT